MLAGWRCACVAVVLSALGASACSPPCESADADKTVEYTEGQRDANKTVYQTSSWEGPYLHFPSGRRFRIEHGLGKTPFAYKTYLAFAERPIPGGNVAESAGNQAVVEKVDDQVIVVRNDTCAEFWLRVVVWAGQPLLDGGTD
jgi:hypothetical protein